MTVFSVVKTMAEFEPDHETQREVFVSNIAFGTKERELAFIFGKCGRVLKVTLPSDGDQIRGFGFITYEKEYSVYYAIWMMNGFNLHGRKLEVRRNRGRVPLLRKQLLQRQRVLEAVAPLMSGDAIKSGTRPMRESSKKKSGSRLSDSGKRSSTMKFDCGVSLTVYFGNLPFSVTQKQLYDFIVKQSGKVPNTTRIILNADGQSRGFAYADFDSIESAKLVISRMNGCLMCDRVIRVDVADELRSASAKRRGDAAAYCTHFKQTEPRFASRPMLFAPGSAASSVSAATVTSKPALSPRYVNTPLLVSQPVCNPYAATSTTATAPMGMGPGLTQLSSMVVAGGGGLMGVSCAPVATAPSVLPSVPAKSCPVPASAGAAACAPYDLSKLSAHEIEVYKALALLQMQQQLQQRMLLQQQLAMVSASATAVPPTACAAQTFAPLPSSGQAYSTAAAAPPLLINSLNINYTGTNSHNTLNNMCVFMYNIYIIFI